MSDSFSLPTELSHIYYPPPPWLLWGSALVAVFSVRAADAEALVPAPLSLVRVPGGLAAGYLAVMRYGAGSTLEYSELIAGVLVRHKTRFGPFVTHIGVDSQPAQRAGRELWYLPKQRWHFEWAFDQPEASVQVWDGIRLVCAISQVPRNARMWPLRTSTTFLNLRGQDVGTITGNFDIRITSTPWRLQPGPDGPLMPLKPASRVLTFVARGVAQLQGLEIVEELAKNRQ